MEEREFKWLVEKNTFNRLYERLKSENHCEAERVLQINYYYDTDCLYFDSIGETIRIRQVGDRLTGTTKIHISKDGSGLSTENSFKISCLSRTLRYKSEDIVFQGELVTERTVISPEDNITICFDKNYYLGTVDYEVELEYDRPSELQANKWYIFMSECIRECEGVLKNRSSKSNRFFKKKKAMLF